MRFNFRKKFFVLEDIWEGKLGNRNIKMIKRYKISV